MTNQNEGRGSSHPERETRRRGRLASSISHEINNPLEAITNLLYLINLSTELPEGIRRYVHTAQNELSRVCQIATQTLRFHRQAVRATHVSAAELVDAVLKPLPGPSRQLQHQVEATYASPTTVLCFETISARSSINLIANAIDAMPPGRPPPGPRPLRHRLLPRKLGGPFGHSQSPSPTRATACPPAVQARLFEPFYTTKDLNGTGLGLWISAGIVSRHKGRLTFRSNQHPIYHGSVFSLFLPSVETSPSSHSNSPSLAPQPSAAAGR